MKFAVAVLVLLAASLPVFGQSKPLDNKSLFVDNIGARESGEDFATAFALEPSCEGLTIYLWANRSDAEQHEAVTTRGWYLIYRNPSTNNNAGQPFQSYAGYLHREKPSRHFTISGEDDRAAARQVCFIMKEKGGRVK